MIKLRSYQQKAIDKIIDFFKKGGKHTILQAPTGAGKTIIFSYIAQNALFKKKKVLIVTDRVELLVQTGGVLEKFGINPFLIIAGTKFNKFENDVFVAMSQTLRNRIKKDVWNNWIQDEIDLVIIDECHKQDFNFLFDSGLLKKKFVIGFTATPRRSGKMRQLALDYEKIIETVTVEDLIEYDYLMRDEYFGFEGVNLDSIKYDRMKGDYSESDMFMRYNTPKLYAGVVKNWISNVSNTHTVVFCVNIEHAIMTCKEFRTNGVDAKYIVSKVSKPKVPEKDSAKGKIVQYQEKYRVYDMYNQTHGGWSGDRDKIINDFKNKKFPVLINVGVLTTGFDCPSIETIVVNRATTSLTLWLQMIGRGSRPDKGKTHFNTLDFGDNANRLGYYTAPQHWGLWHDNKEDSDGIAPVKDCGEGYDKDKNGIEGCRRLILSSLSICPFCGFIYPKINPKEVELYNMIYDEVKHKAVAVQKVSEMSVDELYYYYKMKGHKIYWFFRQVYQRGGAELLYEVAEDKGWKKGTIEKAVDYFKGL